MKLEIPPTKLLIAIFACAISIVSTTNYSTFDDVDRITRNAAALPKSEFRNYIDSPETLHVLRRSAQQDRSKTRVKHRHRRSVVINVTGDQSDSFNFEHPPEYAQIIEKFYLKNLHTADRLAENAVSIIGFVLKSPYSALTSEQYSSLEMIYNAIKRRQFHMYRLLRKSFQLYNRTCNWQFHFIMQALSANLPPYLACAANFLVSQIDLKLLDVNALGTSVLGNLNFLTGIDKDALVYGSLYVKAMEQNGYDDASRITEATVGPHFVYIFALMSNHSLTVSQPLFASVLLNLPNYDGDPIFNEYVRFVAKIAWEGKIPNWSAKRFILHIGSNITHLISAMQMMICADPDVSYDIKQALSYIKNHFISVVNNIIPLSANEAYRATLDGFHVDDLFALITPQEFSPHANRLKAQLTEYIGSHEDIVQKTLAGINLHGYTSLKHLLLAFLTRLRTRLPAEEVEIRKSVSALLSILMLKRQTWNFGGLNASGITLWTLLDGINDSQTNPKMAELVQTILNDALGRTELWGSISNMAHYDNMNKCNSMKVCLREMVQTLVKELPPNSLSPATYIAIEKLVNMISDELKGLSIPFVPNEPSTCDCATTHQPRITVTSESPPGESREHDHTMTVRPSIPASGESLPGKVRVHDDTMTVRPSIPARSESPPGESSEKYNSTTFAPSTSLVGISTEPTEHRPRENPHEFSTSGRPESRPTSPSPNLVIDSTTNKIIPEGPPTYSSKTTVEPSTKVVAITTAIPMELNNTGELKVHDHTMTVRPSIPASSESPPGESREHDHTMTVRPSIPASSESPSGEVRVRDHTMTVRPSIPARSESPPGETSEKYNSTTFAPSTSLIGISTEPTEHRPRENPHEFSTSGRPESRPTSPSPNLVIDSTTNKIIPEGPLAYSSTTVEPSTKVVAITTAIPMQLNDTGELMVHDHTMTVRPSIPARSESPPGESREHDHTMTVRPFIPASSESLPGKVRVHDNTITVRPSIPASSESPSGEVRVRDHTMTVRPSIPARSESPPGESSEKYNSTTFAPSTSLIGISTEPTEHRPRENQATENPHEFSTLGRPESRTTLPSPNLVIDSTTNKIIPEEPPAYSSTTVEPSTKVVAITTAIPMQLNNTVQTDTVRVLPKLVYFTESMPVYVPDSGFTSMENVRIVENSDSPNILTVPSISCLEETPSVDELKGTCEKDLIPITRILTRVFGEDYNQVLLGNGWRTRYPTRISYVVDLLEKAEKSDKLSKQEDYLRKIKRYKTAMLFVSSYVLLPWIYNFRDLTTSIVWSTYNPKNPSESNIGSYRPQELPPNVLALPLLNPRSWFLPVDTAHPCANLLPRLPPNDPYAVKIKPLKKLFRTGKIRKYLGSNWNPSQYTNRGELFTSVLHRLEKLKSVRSNRRLYDVVRNYLTIIERAPQYMHIPRSYINSVLQQYFKNPETYGRNESFKTLTDFVETPLTQKLPRFVYPAVSIHVKVSDLGIASLDAPNSPASSHTVMLPSFDCLLNKPRPEDNPETRCQKDLTPISKPLIHIFGDNYIQELLGNNWETLYPTRISLLVALLTAAVRNPKCQSLIAGFNRYMAACEFVASYVLLPLVVDSQNLKTVTVWSTFDNEDVSRSTIGSHKADGFGPNAVIVPLINPKIWRTQVDQDDPFAYFEPYLPENDLHSNTFQPLFSLFKSGHITELLGSSWNSSDYSDRGSLLVSVLRRLMTLEDVKSDVDLSNLLYIYLMALKLPALYVHVPDSYVKTIFSEYNIPWMKEEYVENIKIPSDSMLPPLINPMKILQVILPASGSPVIESVRSKKLQPKIGTILPSVDCLQGAPTVDADENAGDVCDSVLEYRLTEPLIEVLGDDYVEQILGADWDSLYPTRISFLAGIFRNAVKNKKILENPKLHKTMVSFKEALEVAAPYIFLPMLANYQILFTPIVWITFNYDKPWQSHMGRNPPQYPDNTTVTLPLVNPKVWYLSVNRHHPFSGFLPDFPSTNPYEEIIAPLRSVLTLQYLRNLTGSEWEPLQYPNRGIFFVSAMHTLLKLGSTRMDRKLYNLVCSYYTAIEIPSLYIHIPPSHIKNVLRTAPGVWQVDLDGLMVALVKATTDEEREYRMRLKVFLKQKDLLHQLAIALPSSATQRHVFLLTIIKAALSSTTMQLATDMGVALAACQTQILTTGAGADVVGWVWASKDMRTTIIDLGKIVTSIIPIERVPKRHRYAYRYMLQYFKNHHRILVTEDFPAYRYHTYGAFLRGYLNHLVYESRVSDEAKQNIELIIPYIRYTGPGAIPMPQPNIKPQ